MLTEMRNAEIESRRTFMRLHGSYLHLSDQFKFLKDYPHTCLIEPPDFDAGLPAIGAGMAYAMALAPRSPSAVPSPNGWMTNTLA